MPGACAAGSRGSGMPAKALMVAQVLDGRAIAERIRRQLAEDLRQAPAHPMLAILAFAGGTSEIYRKAQVAQARALGIQTQDRVAAGTAAPGEVEAIILRWNADPAVHGIFVHQPMPPQIDPQRISALIDPRKDIEGIHPQNAARRFFAKARIGSCTALAVMELVDEALRRSGQMLEGKEAVVIGHSEIVGRPVSMLLLDRLATTTVCHIGTDKAGRLEEHVRQADVLVVAVGKPQLIKGAWIKHGAIVIDVGINVVNGRVVGDVEFEAAKSRAAFISPVPGGVGPVTVMMVMKNTLEAFKLQQSERV